MKPLNSPEVKVNKTAILHTEKLRCKAEIQLQVSWSPSLSYRFEPLKRWEHDRKIHTATIPLPLLENDSMC